MGFCAPNTKLELTAAGALVCGCEAPKDISGWCGAALLAGSGSEVGGVPAEDPPTMLLPAAEPPISMAAVAAA